MFSTPFICFGFVLALIPNRGLLVTATSTRASSTDPCTKIAGVQLVDPADAIACQKSFAFNETLRQNLLAVVSGVFDFYTYEDFYLDSPHPFEDSKVDIRAEIARIKATQYVVSTLSNNDTPSMNNPAI